MKANSFPLTSTVVVALAFLLQANLPAVTVLDSPLANLGLSANPGSVTLNITNFDNRVWVIQGSSDLKNWNQLDMLKVFNGDFHRTYPINSGTGFTIFRAMYDSAVQTIP